MPLGFVPISMDDIELELYGNNVGSRSLIDMAAGSNFGPAPHAVSDWENFNGTPGTINNLFADDLYPSHIAVTWEGVDLPTNFRWYRFDRRVNGGAWTNIATTTNEFYDDYDVTLGNDYQYRVAQVTYAPLVASPEVSNTVSYGL